MICQDILERKGGMFFLVLKVILQSTVIYIHSMARKLSTMQVSQWISLSYMGTE